MPVTAQFEREVAQGHPQSETVSLPGIFTGSMNDGARNYPDDRIANLDDSTAFWIKVTARADGSFTVMNARTGQQREYPRR